MVRTASMSSRTLCQQFHPLHVSAELQGTEGPVPCVSQSKCLPVIYKKKLEENCTVMRIEIAEA